MSGFSFSVRKPKNVFQKQKEIEEERKKRDDEEAAKVYEEFVAAFAGEEKERERGPKAFVSGGTIQPGSKAPVHRRQSKGYVPSFMPPGMAAAMGQGGDKAEGGGKQERKEESVFQPPTSHRGKVRSIDLLLQNMKKEQEERASRREAGLPPVEEGPGSFDTGDPTTTNLYIGNLAPDVDEHVLMREFGRFGPIGSVKIMWPRDEEQRRRGRNNGFVAFMRREDADKAKEALDGVTLHDMQLTIGWGKAVQLPAVPCWPPPGGLAAAREGGAAVPPPSAGPGGHGMGGGHHGRGDEGDRHYPGGHFLEGGGPRGKAPRRGGGSGGAMSRVVQGVGPDIEVTIPADQRQRFVVDAIAFYVMRDGTEFEQVIMEREHSNPEFNFLFDVRCPEHAYYRWRLFSLANGDSLRSWRVEPFLMVDDSNRWLPPPMTLGVPDHKTAAQRGDRREDRPLSDLQRDKFEDMLRRLTAERADVCNAMAFAMDNAESATEVVEVLSDALTLSETPVPLKVARLFLASDILHNSTAPVRNASRYRSRLEEHLPDVFESLQEAYRSCESRMGQELLRRHVLKVLRAWRGWFIFGDDFLNGLQATFLRGSSSGEGGGSGGAAGSTNPELEAQLEALSPEDLEAKCRRSGVSRKGGKAAQISRLLAVDAYLNGDKLPTAAAAAAGGAAGGGLAGGSGGAAGGGVRRPGSAGVSGASGGWADVTDKPTEPARPLSKWELQDQMEEGGSAEANMLVDEAPAQQAQQAQQPAPPAVSGPLASSRWATAIEDEEGGAAAAAAAPPDAAAAAIPAAFRRAPSAEGGGSAAAARKAGSDSEDDVYGDIFGGFGGSVGGEGSAAAAAGAATPSGKPAEAAPPGATPRGAQVPEAAVGGAGAEKPDAADEERRQRLRQVEVSVMLLREELEEQGVDKEELERRAAELRAKLVAEAEAAAAEPPASARDASKGGGSRVPHKSGGSSRSGRDREKERDKERDKERGRSERDREREREGRDRKRSRSREHQRGSRRSSRSRSRDRDRDRGERGAGGQRQRGGTSRSCSRSPSKRSRSSRDDGGRGGGREGSRRDRSRDRSRSRSRSRDRRRR